MKGARDTPRRALAAGLVYQDAVRRVPALRKAASGVGLGHFRGEPTVLCRLGPSPRLLAARSTRFRVSAIAVALVLWGAVGCGFRQNGLRQNALASHATRTVALNPDRMGVNGNLTPIDHPWTKDSLLDAFATLSLGHLRYPAGTLGNYWDWDRGWIDAAIPDSLLIKWVVANRLKESPKRYTLEDLALVHERTGVVPVFMLNMLSKDLDHSLRNLRRAERLGMPVRYVEMGNELYFDIPFPKLRYPTPEEYGRTCQRWIDTLSVAFPEAQFAVVGTHMSFHPRQVDWTARVLRHCPGADAVTFHQYAPSGLDGRLLGRDPTPGLEGTGNLASATREGPSDIAARQAWERALADDPAAWANVLTGARANARAWRDVHVPEGMPIWATEFNMRDDNSVMLHSWGHALLLSVYYGEFYDSPIALTSIHNLVGPTFGLLFDGRGGLRHLRDQPRDSEPYSLSAGGIVTALFAEASRGARRCEILDYPGAASLTDDRGVTFASVRGYRFSDSPPSDSAPNQRAEPTQRPATVIINYGLTPAPIALEGGLRRGSATIYSARVDQSISGWGDVEARVVGGLRSEISLPPRSITVFRSPAPRT